VVKWARGAREGEVVASGWFAFTGLFVDIGPLTVEQQTLEQVMLARADITAGFEAADSQTFIGSGGRRLEGMDAEGRRLTTFDPSSWRLKMNKKFMSVKAGEFRKAQTKEMFLDVEIPAAAFQKTSVRAKIDSFHMKQSIEDLKVVGSAMGGTWTFFLDCTSDPHNSDCVATVHNEKYYYEDEGRRLNELGEDGCARNLGAQKVNREKRFRGVAGSKVCYMADTLRNKRDNC
jgi:hypothetical protein